MEDRTANQPAKSFLVPTAPDVYVCLGRGGGGGVARFFLSNKRIQQTSADGGNEQDDWAFTPTSRLPDAERFRGVEPMRMTCRACGEETDFQGVFAWDRKKPVNGPSDIKASAACGDEFALGQPLSYLLACVLRQLLILGISIK